MNDRDVQRLLDEKCSIAGVLLSRGGWVSANRIGIECRFAAEGDEMALWRIDLYPDVDPCPGRQSHSLYVKAEAIVGVSLRRYQHDS